MNEHTAIADAVVESLNGETFNPTFTAARKHRPSFDLPDLADLRVTVVPRRLAISRFSRKSSEYDYTIDVAVQQKVHDDEEIDALLDLAEQILDYLNGRRLSTYPQAGQLSAAWDVQVAEEHLDTHRVCTSVVSVTYRTHR